jgi:hypothetical protein
MLAPGVSFSMIREQANRALCELSESICAEDLGEMAVQLAAQRIRMAVFQNLDGGWSDTWPEY